MKPIDVPYLRLETSPLLLSFASFASCIAVGCFYLPHTPRTLLMHAQMYRLARLCAPKVALARTLAAPARKPNVLITGEE